MKLKELLEKHKDEVFYNVKFEIGDILISIKNHAPELLEKDISEDISEGVLDDITYSVKKALEWNIFNDYWTSEVANAAKECIPDD